MCESAVLVGIGNTLPGRSNADTDMVRDGTYRMLRKVADRTFEEAAFRDIARLESHGPAADAILSYRLHRSGASSRATADDPRQLVERRPRLTPRRPELTEDGGDRRPLLEQRLAGLEQALGVGTGQRAADGQRSRNPSTSLQPHRIDSSERMFAWSNWLSADDYRARLGGLGTNQQREVVEPSGPSNAQGSG
jgi:hypothetical protein